MLLFSRRSVLAGAPVEVMAAAAAITERVNEVIDNEVSLWAGGPGYPLGTTVWSMGLESHAQMADITAPLLADAKYNELAGALTAMRQGDTVDTIRELVHGAEPDPAGTPVGSAVWSVTAQAAGGNLANAMAWGAEVSDFVNGLTGQETRFFRDLYGPFGQVTWLTPFADGAAVDAAQAAMAASPDYLAMVDKAGEYFLPGSGVQGIANRVA